MEKIVCLKCNHEVDVPQHCGKPMHIEGENLVCWMGSHCGVQPIPEHCGQLMVLK